jgi:hypothetical protein
MGFYSVENLPKFTVIDTSGIINTTNINNYSNPVIIYASFELTLTGEFKIKPLNIKQEYGYFLVTQPDTEMSIQFIGNSNSFKNILGMISFNYPYSVQQISNTTFQFNLLGLPTPSPFFGTLSLMLYR